MAVPAYGSILRTFSGGIIRYTGLQIDARKRMSHRYQGGIAYTLSRGKDNSFNMISNIQDPYHPEFSYGPSNNDVHHQHHVEPVRVLDEHRAAPDVPGWCAIQVLTRRRAGGR
jgi:hypothetical protein